MLATIRTGEPPPDAVDSLWKDAGARRIELERISDNAIVELVEAGLERPVEHATMRQIVDACAGNPLYARELVVGAIEDGSMRCERGLWRMEGRPAVTPSVKALIKRRIGALEPEVLRPLELLALGEPLRLGELVALTSFEALQSGEERGMLAVIGAADDADVRLGHPLYGDVIRDEMPVLRARTHRVRLAEIIQEREPLTPEDALRAVRWLMDAGAEIPPEILLDAADAASIGDPALAAMLAKQAVEAGGGLRSVRLLARAHAIATVRRGRRRCLPPRRPRPRAPPSRRAPGAASRSCTSASEWEPCIGACGEQRKRERFLRVPRAGPATPGGQTGLLWTGS